MMFEDEGNLSDETRRLIESEIMALLKVRNTKSA